MNNRTAQHMVPHVSILIVSYNTANMTRDCLESIQQGIKDHSYEVVVVDNRSIDGSAEVIANVYPDATLISLTENIGFARANNLAADKAIGQYLLLLNPDTVVLPDAIDNLLAFAEARPEAKIWGGRTLFPDGTLNPTSCWGKMTVWSTFCIASGLRHVFSGSTFFNPESYGGWARDSIRNVDIVTGCFFLINRSIWNQLGGFNPRYFMYGEEADLCLRASAIGARPLLCPTATIVHYGSASEPTIVEKQIKLLQGKVTLMKEHWPQGHQYVGKSLLLLRALNHSIAYRLLALVLRRVEYKRMASLFAQVWNRRKEWCEGYSRCPD